VGYPDGNLSDGSLVEGFPLVDMATAELPTGDELATLAQRLAEGYFDDPDQWWVKNWARGELQRGEPCSEVEEIPSCIRGASCEVFGHMCPIYFNAWPFCEDETPVCPDRARALAATGRSRSVDLIGVDHVPPMAPGDSDVTKDDGLFVTTVTLIAPGLAATTVVNRRTGQVTDTHISEVPPDLGTIDTRKEES
jgi:hypothetical protein